MQLERRTTMFDSLSESPRRVEALLRGLPRAVLVWVPAPGKWSILEVLCHLGEIETEVYRQRYTVGAEASFPFDAHLRALQARYTSQKPLEALRAWKRARKETLALAVELAARSDLEAQVVQHSEHDRVHLAQIDMILERHATLARLAATPLALRERVEAAALALSTGVVGPKKVAIAAAIGALCDFEQRMQTRYVLILENERPTLRPFDADRLESIQDEASIPVLLRQFEALRRSTSELLHALGPKLWQRRGVHPRRGDLSIAELVAQHLDHDSERLAALRALQVPRIQLEAATAADFPPTISSPRAPS